MVACLLPRLDAGGRVPLLEPGPGAVWLSLRQRPRRGSSGLRPWRTTSVRPRKGPEHHRVSGGGAVGMVALNLTKDVVDRWRHHSKHFLSPTNTPSGEEAVPCPPPGPRQRGVARSTCSSRPLCVVGLTPLCNVAIGGGAAGWVLGLLFRKGDQRVCSNCRAQHSSASLARDLQGFLF